jgi:hypothetical protein
MKRIGALGALAALSSLLACGPIIGDACTVAADCGGQLCINKPYTPGGYCSKQCTVGDEGSCPAGSSCVRDGNGSNSPACFHNCSAAQDCRAGYACLSTSKSPRPICVGPGFD